MISTTESKTETNSMSTFMLFILLVIGVFALSLAAIWIKLSEQYIGPNATIFNRFWIATVILGAWRGGEVIASQWSGESSEPSKAYTLSDIGLLLVSAIAIVVSQLLWAWSLTQTSVANGNLLHNLTPIFATFGGWLLLKHTFDRTFLLGMLLTIGGSIAIGVQDLQVSREHLVGDACALLSAVFYAANLLAVEKLRHGFSTLTILLSSCFLRVFLTFPVTVLTEERLFPTTLESWIPVVCLALFCQVIGSFIINYSLKRFASGFVALFLLLEPIITTILAWVIFAEHLNLLNFLAFAVVLFGIYLSQSGQRGDKVDENLVNETIATE